MLLLARHRLETDRLVLRRLEDTDADRMVTLANHIEIARNLATMPHPYTRESALAFIARTEALKVGLSLAITLKPSGELIGIGGWGPMSEGGDNDFGYWIGLDYWGNGYASEAGAALLTHAFCVGQVDEIITDCRIDNPGSRRILEKLGFETLGRSTRYSLGADEEAETEKVRLTCDDWLAMKACA